MPSLNNYNSRSQMTSDIPLCRTNKGQKSMSFLGPRILIMLNSNINAAATTASFTHSLKKEIIEKRQQLVTELIFADSWFFFFRGTLVETKTVLDLSQVILAIFDLEFFLFFFFFAFCFSLSNYLNYLNMQCSLTLPFFLFY